MVLFNDETKPRIIYSHSAREAYGGGWIVFFYEGAIVHKTFDLAVRNVNRYCSFLHLMALEPLNQHIH